MSTEAGFLADIVENPDDDAPRLVYADWLDDEGRAEQAEFIRVQCELARMGDDAPGRKADLEGREQQLLVRGSKGWAGRWLRRKLPRQSGGPAWSFRRGMVEKVTVTPRTLLRHADELFRRFPIRHVRLMEVDGLAELARCPHIRRLDGLEVVGGMVVGEANFLVLLRSPHVPRLRSLVLESTTLTAPCWRALERLDALSGLTHLALRGIHLRDPLFGNGPSLDQMLAAPVLRSLTSMEMRQTCLTGGFLLPMLFRCPQAGQLRELKLEQTSDLSVNRRIVEGGWWRGVLPAIFGSRPRRNDPPHPGPELIRLLSGLRRLRVVACRVTGDSGLHHLLQPECVDNLRELDLGESVSAPIPASTFATPAFARLARLSLAGQNLGDFQAEELVNCPALGGLVSLDLSGNRLGPDAVRCLAESSHLTELRKLSLRGNPVGPGLGQLFESDRMDRLTWLDLRKTELRDADALILARRAAGLPRLTWLDLRGNPLAHSTGQALRKAFGAAVRHDRACRQ